MNVKMILTSMAGVLLGTAVTAATVSLDGRIVPTNRGSINLNGVSVLDFGEIPQGGDITIRASFGLGDTGRDESLFFVSGPNIDLISGPERPFLFGGLVCGEIGIGSDCDVRLLFRPDVIGPIAATYRFSASYGFEELHGDEAGQNFFFDDQFVLMLTGEGVANVPVPPAMASSLTALGALAAFGGMRRRRRTQSKSV